jgi:hypothetical protein
MDGLTLFGLSAVSLRQYTVATAVAVSAIAGASPVEAQDRGWVLEIGPAAEWPLQGDTSNYGGNIAIEREVIEGWLEIELGMSGLWTAGRGELSWD